MRRKSFLNKKKKEKKYECVSTITHPTLPVAIIDYKTFPMFPSHYGCYDKSYS